MAGKNQLFVFPTCLSLHSCQDTYIVFDKLQRSDSLHDRK